MASPSELSAMLIPVWLTQNSINASLNNIPLLYELYKNGSFRQIDYGTAIRSNITLGGKEVRATDASGNGMTSQNGDVVYAPEVKYKTIATRVPIAQNDILSAKSKEAKVDIIAERMVAAQSQMLNTLNAMAWSDGTGDGGLAFDGLDLAIAKTPSVTAYAGINPAIVTPWQNYSANLLDKSNGLPNNGVGLGKDNCEAVLSAIIAKLELNGQTPTHIFADEIYYTIIDATISSKQQIITNSSDTVANLGFRHITYKGIKIINAGGLKRTATGAYKGIAERTMYFITLDMLEFAYVNLYSNKTSELKALGIANKDINAVVFPDMENGNILHKDTNLDYYINLAMHGNFLLKDRKVNAVVYEEVLTP